ncbi:DNA alkylation response protein [Roseococcus sp. SYP-B2431]|uniref:acyl-CoA dehydrogenase family protein n=1 Tax=Roseococcus sp. SYP-B2431 TaxID=2496640 RepID=UPI00103CFFF4|nr:acyl-CoA dehydrogenase family protein [Roseococcus sp. SYP-B2431]TCH98339.1 DNA alkylation response protein [Roseococcus sp. SYP-B2431]
MNEITMVTRPTPDPADQARRGAVARRSQHLAPDCSGLNFFEIDRSLCDLLPLYMEDPLLAHLAPHLQRLGVLAGSRLNDLAHLADRHPPQLHQRDRYGRDEEWIEAHPAYDEIRRIAFGEFGMHAMTHRPGVLGWDRPMPLLAKQAFFYLFAQAEFGVLCPVNLTDCTSDLIARYGSEELKARYLDRLWTQDMDRLLYGAQFMTEKIGGSDAGSAELVAVRDGEHWRLYGEKWFCSNADGDVCVLLARPEGAVAGSRGLGLFLLPRTLPDGSRNSYRIVRLKDKLGSRSMPSGEIVFDGAVAYQLGAIDRGMKQMLEMVNPSRVSHLTRAAGMMRRCLNEAMQVARHRNAFGKRVIEHPLMRRQLVKIMIKTEQSLSAVMLASVLDPSTQQAAPKIARLLTPICKYRASRDNIAVATAAMEARGGNGYIEDWVNARLVRDAHLGVIWDGTSSVNALDAIHRAVRKERAHHALGEELVRRLAEARGLPGQFRTRMEGTLAQAIRLAEQVADTPEHERFVRVAASALYHVTTAILMMNEGCRLGAAGGDARRLLMGRFVLEHRLADRPKLAVEDARWEEEAISLLLEDAPVPLDAAAALMTA